MREKTKEFLERKRPNIESIGARLRRENPKLFRYIIKKLKSGEVFENG